MEIKEGAGKKMSEDSWVDVVLVLGLVLSCAALGLAIGDTIQSVREARRDAPACVVQGGVQVKGIKGRAVCVVEIKLR